MKEIDKENSVVVATGNGHKLTEIRAILSPVMPGITFYSLKDLDVVSDPEENGETFYDNAVIKAVDALEKTGVASIADDSGLVVDALGGEPGVYSARYAGVHGDDKANNALLIKNLKDVEDEKRSAHFHSCVVIVFPDGELIAGEGDCEGYIAHEPHGNNGFGYDPYFLPNDTPGKTMADLSPEEKNSISHRFHALEKLAGKLSEEY